MADGAEEDGGKFSQFLHDAVRQRFVGAQIAFSAEVVVGVIEFESEFLSRGVEHLDGFPDDLGPGAVAADDCDIVRFHWFRAKLRSADASNGAVGGARAKRRAQDRRSRSV
jgi:hypothetical protein